MDKGEILFVDTTPPTDQEVFAEMARSNFEVVVVTRCKPKTELHETSTLLTFECGHFHMPTDKGDLLAMLLASDDPAGDLDSLILELNEFAHDVTRVRNELVRRLENRDTGNTPDDGGACRYLAKDYEHLASKAHDYVTQQEVP